MSTDVPSGGKSELVKAGRVPIVAAVELNFSELSGFTSSSLRLILTVNSTFDEVVELGVMDTSNTSNTLSMPVPLVVNGVLTGSKVLAVTPAAERTELIAVLMEATLAL